MLLFFVLFCTCLNGLILANPVSLNLGDLDADIETLPVEEPIISNDSSDSEYAECVPDPAASTKKNADSGVTDNAQNPNIFRRLKTFCPSGFIPTTPNREKVPAVIPKLTPAQPGVSPNGGNSEIACNNPDEPKLVSCGGAEMRDRWSMDIWYVANCVLRIAPDIPARPPMPRVIPPNIAQYCCAEYDGRTPLFAAAVCTKMTPFVAISYFLRDNPSLDGIPLNKWLAP